LLIVEKAAWAKFSAKLMFFPQSCKFTGVFWTEKHALPFICLNRGRLSQQLHDVSVEMFAAWP
jgi:hypothetical protein